MPYRWNSSWDWLNHKLDSGELTYPEVLIALRDFIDNDQIQDVFQAEMDEDGFFEED